ncbi:DMT family transporter [Tateyamaria omphalii]|uniref:EamA family transporter n=1 Tax=Tateyamaria omphalii TaxID=299262 RepID=A0A1P8MTA7_9RHOB|nr:DMT family transporter [Tateyamaria omphalii]APX11320.1 EamA family transporter [Tateyamaria omphalii]
MDNLRGAAIMVLAMLGFAIEDAVIKFLAGALPVGQVVGFLGIGGTLVFALIARAQGQRLWDPAFLSPAILIRNLAEVIGLIGFVSALALIPLSTASAILQAAPLLVTLGAALFLGEDVGWRRWAAIFVGFVGVMLIIKPGTAAFDWKLLFAVMGVLGLAARDLATRRVQAQVSSVQLSFLAFLVAIPGAVILLYMGGDQIVTPTQTQLGLLFASVAIGCLAYFGITVAMRVGEISFVTPFRYSRMVFALILGMLVFNERPDALTLFGAAIIILSGLYTLWREQIRKSPDTA